MRENLLAASASTGNLDYIRSVLRGVLVVHATRHYEYSACVPGHQLLSESDVLACFVAGRGASDDATTGNLLKRRSTSEGKFFCGQRSGSLMLLARSKSHRTGSLIQDRSHKYEKVYNGLKSHGVPSKWRMRRIAKIEASKIADEIEKWRSQLAAEKAAK